MTITLSTGKKVYRDGRVTIEPVYGRLAAATDFSDLRHISDNIRDCDRHEFASVGTDPEKYSDMVVYASREAWLVRLDGEPVFVWGAMPSVEHVWMLFGWGTDKTPRIIPALTRWAHNVWIPAARQEGVTRMEVRVPASCTHSVKWLTEGLGGQIECAVRGQSVFGELYFQIAAVFAPLKDNNENNVLRECATADCGNVTDDSQRRPSY